jgi:hypothetical protein
MRKEALQCNWQRKPDFPPITINYECEPGIRCGAEAETARICISQETVHVRQVVYEPSHFIGQPSLLRVSYTVNNMMMHLDRLL